MELDFESPRPILLLDLEPVLPVPYSRIRVSVVELVAAEDEELELDKNSGGIYLDEDDIFLDIYQKQIYKFIKNKFTCF